MSDLQHRLRLLAAELEWPETPPLELPPLDTTAGRSLRRPVLVLVAALVLAAGAAAAIPSARSAVLHWFRIGGITVERVQTLPAVPAGSFTAWLGPQVDVDAAARALGRAPRLPRSGRAQRLFLRDGVVSTVLETRSGLVLLSELRSGQGPLIVKKLAAGETSAEFLDVPPGGAGVWLTGARHVVFFPSAPPRLAGNVLIWSVDGLTYRLEGPRLGRAAALALAARAVTGS